MLNRNHWNHKIVQTRDPSWREKMIRGKQKYAQSPTKLRLERIAAGKSQNEVAIAADLSLTTYGDIERGKRTVRKETAELIAQIIGKQREKVFIRAKKSRFIVLKG